MSEETEFTHQLTPTQLTVLSTTLIRAGMWVPREPDWDYTIGEKILVSDFDRFMVAIVVQKGIIMVRLQLVSDKLV